MNKVKCESSTSSPETFVIRSRRKWKGVWAFFLGVLGLLLMFFIGETFGERASYVGLGVYFLASQYLLSRGHPRAIRHDWAIILTLNFWLLISSLIAWCVESRQQGVVCFVLAVFTTGCSIAGAALAARLASQHCQQG